VRLREGRTRFKDGGDILLSYVAKFRTSKNHLFLLDVLKKLPERFKLFIKGPLVEQGPASENDMALFKRIADRIQQLGLQNRVELKSGFSSDIADYYRMSDIYLFPSINEGLGTPVLEAIASGLPVISNRIPGVTDVWIEDGFNGYLSNLDPDSFAEKIMLAEKIPDARRTTASRTILSKAGCDVIDELYREKIIGLTEGA
jgi:glycosyltransferase involved in cell wall biosynthesis